MIDYRRIFAREAQMHAPYSEQFVIAAMFLEPSTLRLLDALEPRDFFDMRHQVLLTAVREIQQRGDDPIVETVDAWLTREDQRTGKHLGSACMPRLAEILVNYSAGVFDAETLAWDVRKLRQLRERREELAAA